MAAEESYYTVLGVRSDSSLDEIRCAHRRLAMQWHPDRWASTPSLLGEANRKFQKIQEAYSVLSDHVKRSVYDPDLYDPTDEYDEGFCDFMQEMLDLMAQVKEEPYTNFFADLSGAFTHCIAAKSKDMRLQKEDEKRRQREQKNLQGQLIAEQKALFDSKPNPMKLQSAKKTSRMSAGYGNNRRLSLGGNIHQTPRPDSVQSNRATPHTRRGKKDEQRA